MGGALGFRIEGTVVHWALVSEAEGGVLVLEDSASFSPPRDASEARALSYVRERVSRIIEQHIPSYGAVKYTEPTARSAGDGPRRRARIEGVILQRMDEAGMVTLGAAYNVISPRLGTNSAKQLMEDDGFRGLRWGDVAPLLKEAILAATAALSEV
jgi:hypothetical protein